MYKWKCRLFGVFDEAGGREGQELWDGGGSGEIKESEERGYKLRAKRGVEKMSWKEVGARGVG